MEQIRHETFFMKKTLTVVICIITTVTIFMVSNTLPVFSATSADTLWNYQCVDTMKISRDQARSLGKSSDMNKHITSSIQAIKNMGANCVALGTPYDDEFLPFLTSWVKEARSAHLHVWFRGNFSGWEGWFDYPKNTDPKIELDRTKQFILVHSYLFQNGDIFTPAPEAENGWKNGSNVSVSDYGPFRQFLIGEQNVSKEAFSQIGKKVEVNWLSMSGGTAKDVLDQSTIDALGDAVTLDHYVSSPAVMNEYIAYFKNTYHAKFILGEFGAPIPDINGDMTEDQQATFVDSVFKQLYIHRQVIYGINYWVLEGGSTKLLNDDGSARKVVGIIKKYYIPARITGHVTDTLGKPLEGILVHTSDSVTVSKTDKNGNYKMIVPSEDVIIDFEHSNYREAAREIRIAKGGIYTQNISLEPFTQNLIYNFQLMLKTFFEQQLIELRTLFQK